MRILNCFGQNLDFRSPETQAIIPTKRELMKPIPDLFRDENVKNICQNEGFQQFPTLTEGLPSAPDAFQSFPRIFNDVRRFPACCPDVACMSRKN